MDLEIAGKTALVAAGSKGLGKAIALRLAAEGVCVAICARNARGVATAVDEISTVATGEGPIGLVADLTSVADLDRLDSEIADKTNGVEILITNAGGPAPGSFDSLNDDQWQSAFELTLMSAIRLTRMVLPHMRAEKWGRVINVASFSVKQPIPKLMLSNSIRLGVVGWAKTLANEVATDGVLVNTICPGWTSTDRVSELLSARAEAEGRLVEDIDAEILAAIPLRRMARPGEFADVVAFLASERASYITGVALPVDGGAVRSAL